MDLFIEGQVWPDFHLRLITATSDALMPDLRPRYLVRAEERIYLEHEMEGEPRHIRPDLLVARFAERGSQSADRGAATVADQPVEITLPMPEEVVERYLTIQDTATREVVTIIEILSPANKRPGSDGRAQYAAKRESVLMSMTNLVEIDLLRGGSRLPVRGQLPPADYYAFVSRGRRRPRAAVYYRTLREPLPAIPIPLADADPDIYLDLQSVFTTVYDRAGYDYSLDYSLDPVPPVSENDSTWIQDRLRDRVG